MLPPVLLTRRIPAAVFSRLEAACDVDLYDGPSPLPADELKKRLAGKLRAHQWVLTDRVVGGRAGCVDAPLGSWPILLSGYDNIDLAPPRSPRDRGHEHAGRVDGSDAELTWR